MTFSIRNRVPFHRRHPVLAVAVILSVSTLLTLGFLHVAHATRWALAASGALLGGVIAGRLLGERVWPLLGGWASGRILALYARMGRRRGARLVMAPYADFVPGPIRQAWEAMAFASALALLAGATLLFLVQGPASLLPWLTLFALVPCATLTFLIVPHWVFARLGLRIWQPTRFVVRSISESYAGIVRVGNGTLLLVASVYALNVLADRATRLQGSLTVALAVGGSLAFALALFGSAAAYYPRHEERVVKLVSERARRLGFTGLRSQMATHPEA